MKTTPHVHTDTRDVDARAAALHAAPNAERAAALDVLYGRFDGEARRRAQAWSLGALALAGASLLVVWSGLDGNLAIALGAVGAAAAAVGVGLTIRSRSRRESERFALALFWLGAYGEIPESAARAGLSGFPAGVRLLSALDDDRAT